MNAFECKRAFLLHLREEERSSATLQKYAHDIQVFLQAVSSEQSNKSVVDDPAAAGNTITKTDCDRFAEQLEKEQILLYKVSLMQQYAASSVNSMLVALNRFLSFIGRPDLRVRLLRIQRQAFRDSEKMLSRKDYMKLLRAAKKKDRRLFLIMETICSTGIRVSELKFITVESIKRGSAEIHNKGKTRRVLLDKKLCAELLRYCRYRKIRSGAVFVSAKGNPLDRSLIWRKMKMLGKAAGVLAEKIFPHNLRHLFAITFYRETGDIVHLADLLGHTSVDTTRIYTSLSIDDYHQCFSRMKLLLC